MKNILKIFLIIMLSLIGNSCLYFGIKLNLEPFYEVILFVGSFLTGIPAALWWLKFFDVKI